jgi:predicted N-acetyltransferase YhbS
MLVRELASLVVSPAWRGQGIGGALVRHLQRRTGPPLWLMCRSQLVPFYRRFGFGEVARKREMPLYFAAVQSAYDVFTLGRRVREHLAIMVWQG